METTRSASPAGKSADSPPAKPNSPVRLLVLLGILVLALGALGYDHFVAKPGALEAYDKIDQMMKAQNQAAAKDSQRLTSEEIQKEIGKAPTKTIVDEDYTVEYYCWWGPVPFLNTYRQYITVVLVGDEPRRVNSHYLNEYPPKDELSPRFWEVDPSAEGDPADEAGAEAGPGPGMMAPPGGGPGGGGGGKRGKKAKSAEEATAPDSETPAEADAPEATDSDKAGDEKPADEKPGDDAPSYDAPSEETPADDTAPEAVEESP